MARKKVLFVAYGAAHIRSVLPIARYIDENKHLNMDPIVLALTTAYDESVASGVKTIGYKDLGLMTIEELEAGKKLVEGGSFGESVSRMESIAYLGRNYCDLVKQYGEVGAALMYDQRGRSCFFPINTALVALEEMGVDMVISTNAPRSEKAFLDAAKKLGIPSIVIWSSLAKHEIEWVGKKSFTDYVCVDSRYSYNKMLEAGRQIEEIRITGNPQFEELLRPRRTNEIEEFRTRKGWGPDDKVLLFAQQKEPIRHPFTGEAGDPQLPQRLNKMLIDSMKRCGESVKLCIRYHPNQVEIVESEVKGLSISGQDENLADLLHSVDGVFTCSSSVGYQAILLGKPVVQGMFSMFSRDVDFGMIGNSMAISSEVELDHMWNCIANDALPKPSANKSMSAGPVKSIVNLMVERLG